MCFPYISGTAWAIKKNNLHVSYQVLKSFQLEQKLFQSDDKISWYLQKHKFANKKSAIGKNPPFWKNLKLFSMYKKSRNRTYIKTTFELKKNHANSSNQTRCAFCILEIVFSSAVITTINSWENSSWHCFTLDMGFYMLKKV